MNKHGDKLKNETNQKKAMRAKFRTGKADTSSVTKTETVKANKLREQGRKVAYRNTAVSGEVRRRVTETNDENNVSGDVVNAGTRVAENGYYSAKVKAGKSGNNTGYGKKLHAGKGEKVTGNAKVAPNATTDPKVVGNATHEAQKSLMKKEIQREAFRDRAVDAAHSAGSISKRFVDKAEDMAGKIAEAITEFVEQHPLGIVLAGAVLIVIIVVSGMMSSCAMMAGGSNNVVLPTSYTAEDGTIVAVEGDYTAIEEALRQEINNIQRDNPGFDEYNFDLAAIEHDPYELATLLTVLYEDYTEAEVQGMLQSIYGAQYTLTKTPVTEIRTRTETRWHYVTYTRPETRTGTRTVNGVTETYTYTVYVPYQVYESYEVEVEYEYHILNTTLTNNGIQAAVNASGLDEEQLERYGVILNLKGNKPDIFD